MTDMKYCVARLKSMKCKYQVVLVGRIRSVPVSEWVHPYLTVGVDGDECFDSVETRSDEIPNSPRFRFAEWSTTTESFITRIGLRRPRCAVVEIEIPVQIYSRTTYPTPFDTRTSVLAPHTILKFRLVIPFPFSPFL